MKAMTAEQFQAMGVGEVSKAYSGKPGCMCGCKGRYYVCEHAREVSEEERGYKLDDDDVSDKQVLRILRLVQAEAACGTVEFGDTYAYAEVNDGKRAYAIYFEDRGAA